MSVTFNPFTGTFDFTGSGSSASKKDSIKAVLLESDYTLSFPVAKILFDDDSILFNDDEEL